MSGGRHRFLPWVLITSALLVAYWVYSWATAPLTIAAAIRDGKVDVHITAMGVSGNAAMVTLTRSSGVSGQLTVVIPSGTVIYDANPDEQRLITAAAVTVVLSAQTPSVNSMVATFCMDEYAATPLDSSKLSFAPLNGSAVTATEETEPLHKLVDCMASWTVSVSDSDKQLAVWAVKDKLLSKSRRDALEFVTTGIAQRMILERRAQLEKKKTELIHMKPSLDEGLIDGQIEAEIQNGKPALNEIATAKATEQITSFIDHARDMISSCGYPAASYAIFQ